MSLTKRQREILKSVVSEFIESGVPVGSLTLADKYDIGVSPATLRSEMSKLVKDGYLYKAHTSAGRIPTTLGFRYFLDEMLKEKELNKVNETRVKEKLFQKRFDRNKFIRQAVRELAGLSNLAAISLVDDVVFTSGLSQLLTQPEFEDLELLQRALEIVESEALLSSIFQRFARDGGLRILVGDEIGVDSMKECSMVCAPFHYFRGGNGYIAAVGPRRMRYSEVIPAVRTVASFIEEAIRGWE